MDDYTQSRTSSGSGIGFLVAAVIVVLVLLYALFAGGSVDPNTDPAAAGAADGTAPVLEETAPAAPAVPVTE
ncbi:MULTISPECIES: hypothetical protein [unclassified Cognatiyoonia]|uniref:hypothetical protein n=1 Tax=unclassified Cognatiyoonia TaxID=2635977 RepID=UPI002A16B9CD|nr:MULTISPECIES: hypothetical protein [unclassified Cognatiyoonia]MDX8349584.1 hypothetical protein [Cognatiyoonia sp. IB215446]MDX8352289.1 hypothetical protein [Cognatiyoonia sp. IB215182]